MPIESKVLHRDLHHPPYQAAEASGPYLRLKDGQELFDASGGAAVACIGHGDERVAKAVLAQMLKLDYCHSLFFSCSASEELSQLLIDTTDGAMSKVFIVNSGSEAMDAAIKLARQYFLELSPPQPQRIRFIARQGSYHGNTMGALGISGHKGRRSIYEPMLGTINSHVSDCNEYRGVVEGESVPEYVERLAQELDAEFRRVGPDTVCAFVAEPIVGAALGCVPPVPGYFERVKAVCDSHGALLILDEVMCGMGRTGTIHAWQQEGVVPDLQTIGKGLGGGYVPVAGLLVGHRVADTLYKGTGQYIHGQTYQAHPMICAAALEVQNIVQKEDLINRARLLGEKLEAKLKQAFQDHIHIGNIRGRGLFWALEFVQDKPSKEPFDPSLGIAMTVHNEAIANGIMTYPGTGSADGKRGDHILISPPYNVTEEDLDYIIVCTRKAIDTALSRAGVTPRNVSLSANW